jgi:hypothetical protein
MVDGAGNVYNTDLQYNAIGITDAEGEYRLIRRDDKLLNFTEGLNLRRWLCLCSNESGA